ncbi:helix-turn-helix transcriptional regulator [Streptomyces albus]|uniref:helix-turn-helix domain-containing protein n=1 Tax=Streptomyces albus TaxID=1888 RepID=UPI0004C5EF03|nr:helix-turn-helix transcriptional regulator [Streptomyces albus]
MATTSAGSAARLQIAQSLAALRQRAGLTLTDVAERVGCSKSTVGRYETWQERARLTVPMVRGIAEACGATEAEREALAELVRGQGEGWWVGDPAIPEWMDPLVGFETAAEYVHAYANILVPGLLQTRTYALATHQASDVRADQDEIERKVAARMRRQDILERENLHLWAILTESVLRTVVGGEAVMAEQMAHLEEMSQRPNIDIQVLPYSSGASAAGSGGHFLILGRDDERRPLHSMSVVYLEMHTRGLYLDDPDDLQAYKLAHAYLRSQAADPKASRKMLAAARQEFSP